MNVRRIARVSLGAVLLVATPACISGVPASSGEKAGYVRCPAGKVEDAEDGNTQVINEDGRGGYWFTSVDTAGSKLDQAKFAMSEGGANGSAYAARMGGRLTEAGKSIYAVLGFAISNPKSPYDASHYQGVSFWAIGPGLVSFKAADVNTEPMGDRCTDCYNKFGVDIYLSDQWTRYTVPFEKMKQSPGWGDPAPAVASHALFALEWHVSKPGASFDFAVDDIEFVGCESADQKPRDFEFMGPRLNAEHKDDEVKAPEPPTGAAPQTSPPATEVTPATSTSPSASSTAVGVSPAPAAAVPSDAPAVPTNVAPTPSTPITPASSSGAADARP